ncbi:MAG TPA: hypothetical protein VHJ76_06225 [Actinomycetota bacterium]|nr:hypothetical protein [Actinomycetota bacterium]
MAQSNGCGQFEVGSRQWNECIHDQATGGGLMPWIVIIPLGVMVVGMMIGFARQFSRAGQQRARAHGAAGTAGSWLIFVSFVELAIGIGSWVGAKRAPGEGGGYAIAATALLGVGILLFVLGVYLKIRGRRRARIYHSGLPGEAVVRAVHQTGAMVNNQPMYAFDLDVSGSGFAPTSVTHREVVPFWYLNRVGPQSRVPVKVDPSNPNRLIFDWDRLETATPQGAASAPAATPGAGAQVTAGAATPAMPTPDSLAHAMQTAREMTGGRSGWHAGRAIGLGITLFVLLIVGAGLYFIGSVFGQVSDVTSNVTDQVEDALDDVGGIGRGGAGNVAPGTTLEVSRRARGRGEVGYSVAVPPGWVDLTGSVEENQGAVLVDVLMKPQAPSETRLVIARSVRYLRRPAPEDATIASVRRGIEREFGDSLVRSRAMRLGGEPAIALDIAPGADGLRSRQVAVVRGGQVLFVNLAAAESEWDAMLPVLEDVLASWQWGPVSA